MKIDFEKYSDGLVPAIVQDIETRNVLMLGYMNNEAFAETKKIGKVTFFSRSKKRLWTKGEESGNFLEFVSAKIDCDNDALLIYAKPKGAVCHKGEDTCWGEKNIAEHNFLYTLEHVISKRKNEAVSEESYVKSLFEKGLNKIAQKVGEEAVELVIESKDNDENLFLNEAADLMFHYLILLQSKGCSLRGVEEILKQRHTKK